MNGLAVQLRIAALEKKPKLELDAARVAAATASLQAKATRAPEFWSVAGLVELRLLVAVAQGGLAAARAGIEQGFADLGQRAPAMSMWDSVHEQAQFVLLPYIDNASPAEAKAARAVLKQLQALAEPKR